MSMARLIHLLRHGPPRRTGLLLGHVDEPPLDADCPHMRQQVEGIAIASIVTSDLTRTALQAARLADHRQVPLTTDPRWRELNFGAWDGLASSDIDAEAMARFWDDPDGHAPPRGERWCDLRLRIAAALEEIPDGALIVTHAGAMRAAISVLTGLDHRQVWALDLPYRALLSLRIWSGDAIAGQIVGLRADQHP